MTFQGNFEQLLEVTMVTIECKIALNQQLISNLESNQSFMLNVINA